MIFISLLMLLAPGFISLRILWGDKPISRANLLPMICDYFIYSFLIMLFVYGVMFFTYAHRTVSFSIQHITHSHISGARFVVQYCVVALMAALILPKIIRVLTDVCKRFYSKNLTKKETIEKPTYEVADFED